MAARYMDAAAHGGQVACELELALAALQHWALTSNSSGDIDSELLQCCQHNGAAYGSSSGQQPPMSLQQHLVATMSAATAAAASGSCGSGLSTPMSSHQALQDMSGSFTSVDSPHSGLPAMTAGQQQQQQQQLMTASSCCSSRNCPMALLDASQAQHIKACLQQHQHQLLLLQDQPVFGLPDVPMVAAAVEVQRLGAFKFKGGALQQLQMVNVSLAGLAGRARFTPAEPPKGKGERVSVGAGIAAQGPVPLPALAQQYRARVPLHILQRPAPVDEAAESPVRDCEAVRAGSLRVTSAPEQLMPVLPVVVESLSGQRGAGADSPALEEVVALRQKSHSFTCGHTQG